MNRRHFFAASLPVLLGGASAASARDKSAPKPLPRRVKIQLTFDSSSKPGATPSYHDVGTMLLITDDGVETYAAFPQLRSFPGHSLTEKNAKNFTALTQDMAPWVRVRPSIEANGKITVAFNVAYEEAAPQLVNVPSAVTVIGLTKTQTVENGQVVTIEHHLPEKTPRILLTATILESRQLEPNPLD